jgi:hypothetical protein
MDRTPEDVTVLLPEVNKGNEAAASKRIPWSTTSCDDWRVATCVMSGQTTPFRPLHWFTRPISC